jgi:drug/metabolite transporter (DMT)-like permease
MKTPRFAFPLFLTGSAMLSAGPIFVRVADVGVLQSAFWRLALAVPLLYVLARAMEREAPLLPPRGSVPWLFLAGFFFAADLAAWHLGIVRTELANAALLGNAAAFLFPIWGYLVARRWPTPVAALALALAAVGIGMLMGDSASVSGGHLFGDLLCFIAAVFYTGYLVVMGRARGGLSAMATLAPVTLAGAICLLPVALIAPGNVWPQDWTPVILLALGSQVVGQGLIIYALPHLTPLASGVGLLIQPVFAALLGYLWFEEILSVTDLAGIAILFVAILLVRRPSAAQPPVEKRVPPGGGAVTPPGEAPSA